MRSTEVERDVTGFESPKVRRRRSGLLDLAVLAGRALGLGLVAVGTFYVIRHCTQAWGTAPDGLFPHVDAVLGLTGAAAVSVRFGGVKVRPGDVLDWCAWALGLERAEPERPA